MVAALRALGFDAMGMEGDRAAWLATPAELRKHNLHGDIACLPFEDGEFEAVIETGLCRSAPNDVGEGDRRNSPGDEAGRDPRIGHDGPVDRCDRTLQPARGARACFARAGTGRRSSMPPDSRTRCSIRSASAKPGREQRRRAQARANGTKTPKASSIASTNGRPRQATRAWRKLSPRKRQLKRSQRTRLRSSLVHRGCPAHIVESN